MRAILRKWGVALPEQPSFGLLMNGVDAWIVAVQHVWKLMVCCLGGFTLILTPTTKLKRDHKASAYIRSYAASASSKYGRCYILALQDD